MLEEKDIEILKELFYSKVGMNDKFNQLDQRFSDLYTSVNNYAKRADAYFQKMVMLSNKFAGVKNSFGK